MTDRGKTKEQLIRELTELRGRVAELEIRAREGTPCSDELAVFRKFAEASREAMGWADLDGSIVYANPALANVLDVEEPDDLLGTNVRTYYDEASRTRLETGILPLVLKQGEWAGEIPLLSVRGRLTPCIQSVFLIRDDSGHPTFFANVITDITQRKRAEEEVSKFKTVLDHANYGVAIGDLQGKLLYVNDYFARVHGRKAGELLGKNLDVFHSREQIGRVHELTAKMAAEGSFSTEEVWHVHADGTAFPTLMNGMLIRDADGHPLFMATTAIDITDRKRDEEALRKARAELEARIEKRTKELAARNEQLSRQIAERQRAEEALRESEERARAILNATTDVLLLLTPDGKVLAANERVSHDTGKRHDAILGDCIYDYFPADVAKSRKASIDEVVRTGTPVRAEDQWQGAIYDYSVYPVCDAEGRAVAVAVHARDITQRKQAERALRMTKFAVDSAADAIYWMGPDAKFIYVNESGCRALGYTREDLLNMTVHDIDPNFPENAWGAHWRDIKERKSFTFESVHRAKDGRAFPVELTVNYLDFEGREYNFAFARDITERKRAEEALRDSENRFRELAELLPQIVYEMDTDGRLTFMNRRGLEVFGEICGRDAFEMFVPEDRDRARHHALRITKGEPSRGHEYTAQRKDGNRFPVIVYSAATEHLGRPVGLRGICVDISERRKLERAIIEIESKERQRIGHDLHDELGQVLTGVAFVSRRLELDLSEDKHPDPASVGKISELVDQAKGLVHDLSVGLSPLTLDSRTLIPTLQDLAQRIADTFNTDCTFLGEDAELAISDEASVQLYRIAQEAANNAVKHAGASRIRISLTPEDESVTLCIADDGSGIKEKPRRKGLGLQVMRHRANLIGAHFDISSAPGEGTTVTCVLGTAGRKANA